MATPASPAPFSTPLPSQGNGMATAGMICGIAGIVLCWLALIGLLLGLLGIIFGAIGISRAGKRGGTGKGAAIAGLVCGILSFFLTGVMAAIAIPAFLEYMNKSKKTESSLHLRMMETKIKSFHIEKARLPKSAMEMPGPAGSTCSGGDTRLQPQPESAWNAAGWNEMGFHVDEASRYSYRWTAESATRGYAEALADLDCDGVVSTTRVDFNVSEGMVRTTYFDPTPD